jgi:hypothetical protein
MCSTFHARKTDKQALLSVYLFFSFTMFKNQKEMGLAHQPQNFKKSTI